MTHAAPSICITILGLSRRTLVEYFIVTQMVFSKARNKSYQTLLEKLVKSYQKLSKIVTKIWKKLLKSCKKTVANKVAK